MVDKKNANIIIRDAKNILKNNNGSLKAICNLLKTSVEHYNWVGFYFMNHSQQKLHIGPYSGAATTHTEIPFGKGICGQVAVSGETFEVPDVLEQDNYLSCSISTKAEMVIPIYSEKELIGQLDIDSHQLNPFDESDKTLLTEICNLIGEQKESFINHLP